MEPMDTTWRGRPIKATNGNPVPCWGTRTENLDKPPKKRIYYWAWVFDPVLKAERITPVTSTGMTKQDKDVQIGIDRVDRWGRVVSCCAKHSRADFANGRGVMWLS